MTFKSCSLSDRALTDLSSTKLEQPDPTFDKSFWESKNITICVHGKVSTVVMIKSQSLGCARGDALSHRIFL